MQYIVQKKGYRIFPVIALAVLALVVGLMNVGATPPSNFMESGNAGGDGNVRDTIASADPPYDWANTGPTSSSSTTGCPTGFSAQAGFTTVNLSGTGGLFNCGQGDGAQTTPIAPVPTLAVGTNNIDAIAFKVDPLSADQDTCVNPRTGLQTADGDPTVYTGAGGEKNGDSLVLDAKGSIAVETWSTSSVPPKDDVSNV